jgi:hypothetical protein
VIPPAYVAWRAGTKNRVVVPARQAGNRFLGSLKGLQIRTQGCGTFPGYDAEGKSFDPKEAEARIENGPSTVSCPAWLEETGRCGFLL